MHQRVDQTLRHRARLTDQRTAHSIEEGTALDAGGKENLLEANLRAAAEATAEDTTQAANAVAQHGSGRQRGDAQGCLMEHVEVRAVPLERLSAILHSERAERLEAAAVAARAGFGDRVVWHVNATAHGGGVAELLQTMLAYGRGAGIDNRWRVLDGDPEFFVLTKRLHNMLHGSPGDGGALGEVEDRHYRAVMEHNLEQLLQEVSAGDLVVLHDPQAAGLAEGLRRAGLRVAWRCHVGIDVPNELSNRAWAFLRPFLDHAAAYVFSRRAYAPEWIDASKLFVIPPSVDPFSAKNISLSDHDVAAILATVGLVSGGDPDGPQGFERRDGSWGTVRRHVDQGGLVLDGPAPPHDARLVVQVSRWDRLKDMGGVMEGFAQLIAGSAHLDTHLLLVGPEVAGVTDDPEGAQVLAQCRDQWWALPQAARDRIHLASIPMDDVDENATVINALQRHASVVVQKSLVEGFGLTVAEAMWKATPVVATRVGGIQDQIVDGRDGLLLDDPTDLGAFASVLGGLLADPERAARLGRAGADRIKEDYLPDRHLLQYAVLFHHLAGTVGTGNS
jgi:trehalose synthase